MDEGKLEWLDETRDTPPNRETRASSRALETTSPSHYQKEMESCSAMLEFADEAILTTPCQQDSLTLSVLSSSAQLPASCSDVTKHLTSRIKCHL
jgi:hypothetical protein